MKPASRAYAGLQVVLIALPGCDVDAIQAEVHRQTEQLPRGSTVEQALSHSAVILARSAQEAASISNMCGFCQLPTSKQHPTWQHAVWVAFMRLDVCFSSAMYQQCSLTTLVPKLAVP